VGGEGVIETTVSNNKLGMVVCAYSRSRNRKMVVQAVLGKNSRLFKNN
jgi:hypothetical protein